MHTPGPWIAHKLPLDRWLISAGNENVAGTASGGFGPNDDATEQANARLIAAAPDLLEALETLQGFADNSAVRWIWKENGEQAAFNKALNQTRAAITKAK